MYVFFFLWVQNVLFIQFRGSSVSVNNGMVELEGKYWWTWTQEERARRDVSVSTVTNRSYKPDQ